MRKPKVPEGQRLYAIGDIHGRFDLLSQLWSAIDADRRDHDVVSATEIYIGDYIDRGPHSKDVIDGLIARGRLYETICLRGNHETYPLMDGRHKEQFEHWLKIGGLATLTSYGLDVTEEMMETPETLMMAFHAAMPDSHQQFLRTLPLQYSCGDYMFVHAGVRPGVALDQQVEEDLLWIRKEFLQSRANFGKIIVHGHTPVKTPTFEINRIDIDTGAYASGVLTCLILEEEHVWLLQTG